MSLNELIRSQETRTALNKFYKLNNRRKVKSHTRQDNGSTCDIGCWEIALHEILSFPSKINTLLETSFCAILMSYPDLLKYKKFLGISHFGGI